jgi:ABC-type cobalamin transport system ATPase subunit
MVVAVVRDVILCDMGRSVVLNPLNLGKPFLLVNNPLESLLVAYQSSISKVISLLAAWVAAVLITSRYDF